MNKNNLFKFVFRLIIFMFSLALAYFTAHYLDSKGIWDFGLSLLAAAGLYTLIGLAVSQVISVSLGFLFAADILILHVLADDFSTVDSTYKILLLAVILVVLYLFAWRQLPDHHKKSELGEEHKPFVG